MAYICLLLSGAALLINGLATLNRLPRRDAAAFSLAVGSIQLVLGVAYLVAGDASPAALTNPALPASALLTSAGMFLFGLTYLYAGLDGLLGLGSKALGWFCGVVALFGLLLAGAWLFDDPLLAVLWLAWSVLWALLFASAGLGLEWVNPFAGWALVLTSQTTATIPAFLGMAGLWPRSPAAAIGAAVLLAVLFFAAGMLARRGSHAGTEAHRPNTPEPAPSTAPPHTAARPADVGR